MNGMEKICDKIIADAREKAAEIMAEAEQAARKLEEEGKAAVLAETAQMAASSQKRADDLLARARLSAAIEGKKRIQNSRQELIAGVFDRALDALCALPADEYRSLLVSFAVSAASDGLGGELVLNEKDRAACGQAVVDGANAVVTGQKLTLAPDSAHIRGGLLLRRGRIEFNCALEVLVRILSEEAAHDVSGVLFGEV